MRRFINRYTSHPVVNNIRGRSQAKKEFFLANPIRSLLSPVYSSSTYIDRNASAEFVGLSDANGGFYNISRADLMMNHRGHFNDMMLSEIQTNLFISKPIKDSMYSSRIQVGDSDACFLSKDDLALIIRETNSISNLYVSVKVRRSSESDFAIFNTPINHLSISEDTRGKGPCISLSAGYALIPFQNFPYYAFLNITIPLKENKPEIEAVFPAYAVASDSSVGVTQTLKTFSASIDFEGEVSIYYYN